MSLWTLCLEVGIGADPHLGPHTASQRQSPTDWSTLPCPHELPIITRTCTLAEGPLTGGAPSPPTSLSGLHTTPPPGYSEFPKQWRRPIARICCAHKRRSFPVPSFLRHLSVPVSCLTWSVLPATSYPSHPGHAPATPPGTAQHAQHAQRGLAWRNSQRPPLGGDGADLCNGRYLAQTLTE